MSKNRFSQVIKAAKPITIVKIKVESCVLGSNVVARMARVCNCYRYNHVHSNKEVVIASTETNETVTLISPHLMPALL